MADRLNGCTDAKVWAEEFIKTKEECGWTLEDIDEGLMIAWFANAMMTMHDKIYWEAYHDRVDTKDWQNYSKELPDRSEPVLFVSEQVTEDIHNEC